MALSTSEKKRVSVCESQPLLIRGLKSLLDDTTDLELHSQHGGVSEWMVSASAEYTEVLVVEKGSGADLALDSIARMPNGTPRPRVVVWGNSMHEAEALRYLQAGARGIVQKSADLDSLLACFRTVANGGTWMQDSVFGDRLHSAEAPRSELTPREQQVLELVEQGLKNREIALELGISPGTVKIHLKHIFEKRASAAGMAWHSPASKPKVCSPCPLLRPTKPAPSSDSSRQISGRICSALRLDSGESGLNRRGILCLRRGRRGAFAKSSRQPEFSSGSHPTR
jgi:DNA-binding NarL/FixJ family response regulator